MQRALVLRGPLEPTEQELWAPLDEEFTWTRAVVPRHRLVELNQQALAFFTDRYPGSWAPGYLRERLGTDLTGSEPFTAGYAPPGWTSLTHHLQAIGATEEELLHAGLARRASTGRLIDAFRDRVLFPIHTTSGEVAGFIARRNPSHDTTDGSSSAPKYLNTSRTNLFGKGKLLFGLHETLAVLQTGATATFVEGPLDAIAITLTSHGTHAGLAPLGTALTTHHATLVNPYLSENPTRILIATDADPAGNAAARKAFWYLTAHRANPQHLPLPPGTDPAQALRSTPFTDLLRDRRPLAHTLLADLLPDLIRNPPGDHGSDTTLTSAANVIAALPPARWTTHIEQLHFMTDIPRADLNTAVASAAEHWTTDAREAARQQLKFGRKCHPRGAPVLKIDSARMAHRPQLPAPHRVDRPTENPAAPTP